MAEREGFEPSVPFPAHDLSRVAQSATLSSLLYISSNKLTVGSGSTEIERQYPMTFLFIGILDRNDYSCIEHKLAEDTVVLYVANYYQDYSGVLGIR